MRWKFPLQRAEPWGAEVLSLCRRCVCSCSCSSGCCLLSGGQIHRPCRGKDGSVMEDLELSRRKVLGDDCAPEERDRSVSMAVASCKQRLVIRL